MNICSLVIECYIVFLHTTVPCLFSLLHISLPGKISFKLGPGTTARNGKAAGALGLDENAFEYLGCMEGCNRHKEGK